LVALKERYPDAQLSVLVGPKAEGVLASSPDVDRVILYDKNISWPDKLQLALRLRKENFDLVIDLRNTAFPYIAGAPLKTSLIRWGERRDSSMRARHFKRLKFLGIETPPGRSFRFIGPKEEASAGQILKEVGIRENEGFAVLVPGARDSKKRWAAGKYGEFGARLAKTFHLKVLLLGSPDEKELLARTNQASGDLLVELRRTISFQEMIGILMRAKLFAGNDSGFLHIAYEMKVPCLGIFGPTNPAESGYWDARSRTVFPLTKDAKDPRGGMESLSVDEVFERASEILKPQGPKLLEGGLPSVILPPKPRILISRIDRIGDVVLTTPIFQLLKDTYPDSFLSVLVSPVTQKVVEGNPWVDEVLVYDKKGKEKSIWGTFRFARRLAHRHFDAAIHFHATNRVFWLSFLARIPIRIGHRRKFDRLLTHAVEEKKREGEKHESEYNLDLLKPLGLAVKSLPPAYFPLHEKDRLSLFQKHPALGSKSYVVLSPSASCISKRWPPERFRSVGEELAKTKGFGLCLIGSHADREICQEVLAGMKAPALNLAGELTLGELGWLLKNSKLLISNDSGPVHIAAALDVPVISLFGRSDAGLSPKRWRPLGLRSFFIHKSEVKVPEDFDYSTPCFRLLSLEPKEVVELAKKILG
jgi:heptosyltransferase-2